MCLTNHQQLIDFQMQCRNTGVQLGFLGPMGKVWENGSVQVVQGADSLPSECHPRDRLKGALLESIAEIIYIPIYDTAATVSGGVLAVLELMVSSDAHDPQVVANTIACVARILDSLALHLSSSGSGAPCSLPGSGPPSPTPTDRVGSTRRGLPPVMRVSAPAAPQPEAAAADGQARPPRSSSAGRMQRTRSLLVIRPLLC
uniref:Uncharacterized protein n=1 Tax=Auxenochlorella protothecoides TaxID=3075 RepID=A0A1D2A7P9_AUXPR